MTHPLEFFVHQFFDEQIDLNRPILLGLSGGPDSICLLHLLLEWQRPITLHLVHVDHGWRKESALEAEKLKALAGVHGLPFHSTRLRPEHYRGNLEMESRR
ncbi:MAG: tRNA lysidine(34) synthetase TilS, partial [Verrucomicrobia bacterium]|nr:tRNA lysidine(34) synthetase TilS [Verrucomicrobiota bacterium]